MKRKVAVSSNPLLDQSIEEACDLLGDLTPCTRSKKFSPSKITVSGGAGAAQNDEVFRYLGLDKIIALDNVPFFDHNEPAFVPVSLSYGPVQEFQIDPYILEYDTLFKQKLIMGFYRPIFILTIQRR